MTQHEWSVRVHAQLANCVQAYYSIPRNILRSASLIKKKNLNKLAIMELNSGNATTRKYC